MGHRRRGLRLVSWSRRFWEAAPAAGINSAVEVSAFANGLPPPWCGVHRGCESISSSLDHLDHQLLQVIDSPNIYFWHEPCYVIRITTPAGNP